MVTNFRRPAGEVAAVKERSPFLLNWMLDWWLGCRLVRPCGPGTEKHRCQADENEASHERGLRGKNRAKANGGFPDSVEPATKALNTVREYPDFSRRRNPAAVTVVRNCPGDPWIPVARRRRGGFVLPAALVRISGLALGFWVACDMPR